MNYVIEEGAFVTLAYKGDFANTMSLRLIQDYHVISEGLVHIERKSEHNTILHFDGGTKMHIAGSIVVDCGT